MKSNLYIIVIVVCFIVGCQHNSFGGGQGDSKASSPYRDCVKTGKNKFECTIPGWSRRKFDMYVPSQKRSSYPAILALHGGGTNKEAAEKFTCTDGDLNSENCLSRYATSQGFVVVMPNGSGRFLSPNVRTFNAGGGAARWICVSGYACNVGVDDFQYFSDLIKVMRTRLPVKNQKIFATGGSNGAAMSHRLACELANEISGIAPVGGANQFETSASCSSQSAMPVLSIHGDSDPCWPYQGGKQACVIGENDDYVALSTTMENWRVRNGCDATSSSTPIFNADPSDGTTAKRLRYKNCKYATELITVYGGGHTWPLGHLHSRRAGALSRDFSATRVVVDFFKSNL